MASAAKKVSEIEKAVSRNRNRDTKRHAIMNVARGAVAQHGTADLSLKSIAKEAKCSIATVRTYFSTEADLFSAIVADDLATLAQQMCGSISLRPEVPEASSKSATEQTNIYKVAIAPEFHSLESGIENSAISENLEPLIEAQEPLPAAEYASPDQSLNSFKKEIELRFVSLQAANDKYLSVIEEATKDFSTRLEVSEKQFSGFSSDISIRILALEKRLRENHSDLRNSLLSASMRIDFLEAAAKLSAPETVFMPQVMPEPPPIVEKAAIEKLVPASGESYITAARRAARTATELKQMDSVAEAPSDQSFWLNRWVSIRLLAILAISFFVIILAVVFSRYTPRTVPIHVVVPASLVHSGKVAKAPPVDRLSTLANLGDSRAQLLVGLRYLKGQGVAIDQPQGAKWIEKAAASAPLAQYWMGQVYQHGEGVSPDAAEALRWYTAAATHGNREAMYDLGVAYAEGLGTQKDFAQSADWFTKAATSGLTNAQFNLAVLYERGEGVSQSLTSAYKWYAIAAASGDIESKARIDAIATQLTASELATAKDAATSFTPQPTDRSANVLPNPSDIIPQRASSRTN